MKIFFISTHINVGGIGVYLLNLSRALKQKGHIVKVISSGGNLEGEFRKSGIELINLDIKTKSEASPKILFAYFKLKKIIASEKPDIMHAHTRVTQVLACILSRRTRIPVVTTCHGFFRPSLLRRILQCWGVRVIAISEAVREHLINDLKVAPAKVSVIHNGIDLEKFQKRYSKEEIEALKNEFHIEGWPVIGIIARLSSVKGHKYLLGAMKSVIEAYPKSCLLIIGDGPEKAALAAQAKSLGIEKNIIFHGIVDDTAAALAIMDVFVMPSLQEGLGLSILEAQAAGVGVVASGVGGIKNLINNRVTGILAQPASSGDLSNGIKELLGNEQLRLRIIDNARMFVKDFSLGIMADKIELLYAEAASVKKNM